jgi:hypothetical protein
MVGSFCLNATIKSQREWNPFSLSASKQVPDMFKTHTWGYLLYRSPGPQTQRFGRVSKPAGCALRHTDRCGRNGYIVAELFCASFHRAAIPPAAVSCRRACIRHNCKARARGAFRPWASCGCCLLGSSCQWLGILWRTTGSRSDAGRTGDDNT